MSMVRPLRQGNRIGRDSLRCMSLEVAHRFRCRGAAICRLTGVDRKLASERQTGANGPERTSLPRETFTASDSSVTNSRAIKSQVSSRAIRGSGLSRRFLLRESCFQPRDVFLEALVVFQQALTGEEEDVV